MGRTPVLAAVTLPNKDLKDVLRLMSSVCTVLTTVRVLTNAVFTIITRISGIISPDKHILGSSVYSYAPDNMTVITFYQDIAATGKSFIKGKMVVFSPFNTNKYQVFPV
jgi:hypothetical protein